MALTELVQAGFERVVEFRMAPRPGDAVERVDGAGTDGSLAQQLVAAGRAAAGGCLGPSGARPPVTGSSHRDRRFLPTAAALQGQAPVPRRALNAGGSGSLLLPIPLRKALQQAYQGISPPLARQLAGERLTTSVDQLEPDAWCELHRHWQAWLTCLETEQFKLDLKGDEGYQVWSASPTDPATLKATAGIWPSIWDTGIEPGSISAIYSEPATAGQRPEPLASQGEPGPGRSAQTTGSLHDSTDLQQQADALLCLPAPNRDEVDLAQKLYGRACASCGAPPPFWKSASFTTAVGWS